MRNTVQYNKDKYKKYIFENEIEEAKKYLLEKVPDGTLIYKYFRGLNRDLSTLENKSLWLANATTLNDPYDCSFLVNKRSEFKFLKIEDTELIKKEYFDQMEEDENALKKQSSVFLAAFSENNNSLSMWGYYAANHMGVCIGYDLRKLIEEYSCLPVIYDDLLPSVQTNKQGVGDFYKEVLTKSIQWEHEAEWRIVRCNIEKTGECGYPLPFIKPSKIILGYKQRYTPKENANIRGIVGEENLYVDINEWLNYAKNESVKLSDYTLEHCSYKLHERFYDKIINEM